VSTLPVTHPEPAMKHLPKTPPAARLVGLLASVVITFGMVWLAAGYGYPDAPPVELAKAGK